LRLVTVAPPFRFAANVKLGEQHFGADAGGGGTFGNLQFQPFGISRRRLDVLSSGGSFLLC
jgi:hypothetical protein